MEKKQKLDKAIELLRKSSDLYDQASEILGELNVITYSSYRPIQRYSSDDQKQLVYIFSGVDEICDIIGSMIYKKGHPYFKEIDDRYCSINVDGIEFYEFKE